MRACATCGYGIGKHSFLEHSLEHSQSDSEAWLWLNESGGVQVLHRQVCSIAWTILLEGSLASSTPSSLPEQRMM
jgi:hypothetical protein